MMIDALILQIELRNIYMTRGTYKHYTLSLLFCKTLEGKAVTANGHTVLKLCNFTSSMTHISPQFSPVSQFHNHTQ